jgi:hypothetical protein
MTFEQRKLILAGTWAICVAIVAVALPVSGAASWAAVASLGLIPPAVAMRLWAAPPQTITESIHRARR